MTSRQELHRLYKLYDPPAFVKEASSEQVSPTDTIVADPRSVYAWPSQERYPVHTPAATWLSAASFYDNPPTADDGTVSLIQRRIKEAAAYFGIEKDIDRVEKKAEQTRRYELEQEPDEAFAFVWVGQNGTKERRLPLRNEMEIKAAADWLMTYRDDFLFRDRQKIASRILAVDKNVLDKEQLETLKKQAADGFCAPSRAKQLVQSRLQHVPKWASRLRENLEKIAKTLEAKPKLLFNRSALLKLAEAIDEVDDDLSLRKFYDDGLERIEDCLFAVNFEKMAEVCDEHVKLQSGAIYKKSDLEQLPLSAIRKHFGEDLAEEISSDGLHVDLEKLAVVMPTLPRPDAEMLERILEDHGLAPVEKEAARGRQGLMNEE